MQQFGNQSFGGFNAMNQGFGGASQMGQQYGNSTFGQFGTDPQVVRQHIQEDLQSAFGGQQMGGMAVRQGSVNGAAMQQAISSVPAQVRGQQGQQLGYGAQAQFGQQFGNSTLGQFGTNPQQVRQHIQEDLQNAAFGGSQGQGAGMGMGMGMGAQGAGMSMGGQGAGMGMGGQAGAFGGNTLGQFGTNPQQVRQHIQEDLQNAAFGGSQGQGAGMMGMGAQGAGMGMDGQAGAFGGNTLGQFGTNPQQVRQHIQEDLQTAAFGGNQGQSAGMMGMGGQGAGMMGMGGQGAGMMGMGAQGAAMGMGSQAGAFGGTLGQFGTNPQQVRQHIQEDLSNAAFGGNQGAMSSGFYGANNFQ
ncbi:hypothetical protein [Alicyclobacillus dauci]|uniref:Uncharacterized protein n=1 Tax=Alicyclobacillus dauci TaxID=1475485 RepID=A0ABY6Z040_9BACL|nr:hypothetical protein [Alicyclobacillus dauci]WAH35938.1 hypothetical protein NZD86_16935 [Alicyclobacillus dauci]